jgi:hypothetical protein
MYTLPQQESFRGCIAQAYGAESSLLGCVDRAALIELRGSVVQAASAASLRLLVVKLPARRRSRGIH